MAGPKDKRKRKDKQNFGSNIVIGGSGNQAGPGGPGSDTYNPNLSAQNQLQAIVDNKQNLQNQAGTPAYADPTHKFYKFMQVPQGGQMTQAQQAIADFYGPSTANAYQQQIQNFIQSNPANMQVYKDSGLKGAGLNAFMTTFPEALAEKSMVMQGLKALTGVAENVYPAISDAFVKTKEATGEMINTGMSAADDALGKGVDFLQEATAPTVKEPKTFTVQSAPVASPLKGIPSILNTSTDTATTAQLNPNNNQLLNMILTPSTGEYLNTMGPFPQRDTRFMPLIGQQNFNQGGLASLNNPDYGMLMNASNFGF